MFSLGIVTEAFYGIVLTLDTWVYGLISSAYKIFMAIASARILSSDAYTSIANKVYIIVGVGMLFVLAYAILKAIIDPDQLSKGDMAGSKILKSIAITVIGLIVTPLIFDLAYMAQGKMLEEDILGKLFFRTGDSTVDVSGVGTVNYDEELEHTGGGVAATSVWMAFFYPAEGVDPEDIIADPDIIRLHATATAVGCAAAAAIAIAAAALSIVTWGTSLLVGGAAVGVCAYSASTQFEAADDAEAALGENEDISLVDAYNLTASGASFGIYQGFIEPLNDDEIKYTWFVSTVCGGFVAYAFVSYAIDMGLRAAKLAYYQIIAPIPLILNVMPKNGDRIGKFVKAVFSTFLEVFVRISVVYIVIYIIAHLQDLFSTLGALWDNEHLTDVESLITMALLIIGLVLFAKQAPKIISDTFGLSNGGALEGLNIMKKLRDGEVFTAGSIAGSTLRSGVQSFNSSFGRKSKIVKDANGRKVEVKRGFGERLAGGIGAGMFGAASGGVRSGVGRARSGKPVGSRKEMHDSVEKTTRAVHDAQSKFQEFDRINDTPDKKFKKVKGMISNKIRTWAVGDEDVSGLKRQEALFDKVKEMESKLEGTVGNDSAVKAANHRISDLSTYESAQKTLFNQIKDNMADKNDEEIAALTGMEVSRIAAIRDAIENHRDVSYTDISTKDVASARDAADDALKTAKKDAVSRKLAEAHATGVENDTSRMAKQLLSDREMLRLADEFEYLTFDTYTDDHGRTVEVTVSDYLKQNFGAEVSKNGTVNFDELFKHQAAGRGGPGGAPAIEFKFKGEPTASDLGFTAADLGVTEVELGTIRVTDAVYNLEHGEVLIEFADGRPSKKMTIAELKKTGVEIASSETITNIQYVDDNREAVTTRVKGTSKKTVFAAAKDKGESKGDEFRGTDEYKDRMAAAREAEKNREKNS